MAASSIGIKRWAKQNAGATKDRPGNNTSGPSTPCAMSTGVKDPALLEQFSPTILLREQHSALVPHSHLNTTKKQISALQNSHKNLATR